MYFRYTYHSIVRLVLLLAAVGAASSAVAQSGDPVVDEIISSFSHRAGSSAAPMSLNPSVYIANGHRLDGCNSTNAEQHEQNCPSDLTYTPNQHTGGGQSFGVGITNYPAGEYWYVVPYFEQVWYWDTNCDCWNYYWDVYWDLYFVDLPPFSLGSAAAGIKWGPAVYEITPTAVLSTAAFKVNGLPWCNPSSTGDAAPCGSFLPQSDSTYVQAAGYEDKILIPETCGVSPRSGTASDGDAGCFYGYEGWTTLPGPVYMDTTKADLGHTYIPAVGMTQPTQVAEGVQYHWLINFFAYQNEPIIGQHLEHRGAVTYRVGLHPFCLANESQFGNAACYFNVDQTRLAPSVQLNPMPPGVPPSITVPSSSAGAHTISWTSASGVVTAYELYEATNSSFSGELLLYSDAATSLAISGKSNGTYYYRVRACDVATCSGYRTGANPVSVVSVPLPPASIAGPAQSNNGNYGISWSSSAGATRYELWESNFGGSWIKRYDGPNTFMNFSNKPAGEYTYSAKACNAAGCSGYSNERFVLVCNPQCL